MASPTNYAQSSRPATLYDIAFQIGSLLLLQDGTSYLLLQNAEDRLLLNYEDTNNPTNYTSEVAS
jgi:hypothetical protein